jgi:hypothetical protein
VGNTKLVRDGERVPEFVRLVGRRFVHENWRLLATPSLMVRQKKPLSGLSFLLSQDLLHLAPGDPEEAICSLQELYLNSTGIDDKATTYLSCCPLLETLGVAGTKLSSRFCQCHVRGQSEFILQQAKDCFPSCPKWPRPKLPTLDLTRCRGVSVADRRCFFEVSFESHGAI